MSALGILELTPCKSFSHNFSCEWMWILNEKGNFRISDLLLLTQKLTSAFGYQLT